MRLSHLGKTGPEVSVLGFGAWGLSGDYGPAHDATSILTIRRALDLGVTLIDTADEYGNGHNERVVGQAIRGRRANVVLATKAGLVRGDDGSPAVCGEGDHLRSALDASLRRLGVDSVDLFYLHRVDRSIPVEESIGAMAELVSAGKALAIGVCEATAEEIRRAHSVHPLSAVQSEYSLFTRDPESGVLPCVRALGIGFVAFSPLGRGLLTGALTSSDAFTAKDFRRNLPRFEETNLQRNLELLRPLRRLAANKGATEGQVALAWLLEQGVVPIPGTRSASHLEENVAAVQVELSAAEVALLDEAFPPGVASGPRYPGAMSALRGTQPQ